MSTKLSGEIRIQQPEFPLFTLGAQHQRLAPTVHAGLTDVEGLSSGVVRMDGGHHAQAHIHEHSPITVYVRTGMIASLVGEQMEPLLHAPGSVVFIASGIPHIGLNLDPVTPAELFEARTDAQFNADVARRPDLDDLVAERVAELQLAYARGVFDDQLAAPTVHIVSR